MEEVEPHVFAAANLAGCADTQRSTSGAHHAVIGPHTHFPIMGRSTRQSATASSTPEAEMVSGHNAVTKVLLPAMDLWESVLPKGFRGKLEDNTAYIHCAQNNRNPTMKQIGRVFGILIAVSHEALCAKDRTINCDM